VRTSRARDVNRLNTVVLLLLPQYWGADGAVFCTLPYPRAPWIHRYNSGPVSCTRVNSVGSCARLPLPACARPRIPSSPPTSPAHAPVPSSPRAQAQPSRRRPRFHRRRLPRHATRPRCHAGVAALPGAVASGACH